MFSKISKRYRTSIFSDPSLVPLSIITGLFPKFCTRGIDGINTMNNLFTQAKKDTITFKLGHATKQCPNHESIAYRRSTCAMQWSNYPLLWSGSRRLSRPSFFKKVSSTISNSPTVHGSCKRIRLLKKRFALNKISLLLEIHIIKGVIFVLFRDPQKIFKSISDPHFLTYSRVPNKRACTPYLILTKLPPGPARPYSGVNAYLFL